MKNVEKTAEEILGYMGRMIGMSKSGYCQRKPRHLVIFNANVCTQKEKIWFGDLDITLDKEKLSTLAKTLKEDIYVLYEMDGRFENEDSPLTNAHIVKFTPEGHLVLGKRYEYLRTDNIYNL